MKTHTIHITEDQRRTIEIALAALIEQMHPVRNRTCNDIERTCARIARGNLSTIIPLFRVKENSK